MHSYTGMQSTQQTCSITVHGGAMAQLMPLPLSVSCFSKMQIVFTFLVPDHPGCPGQRATKRVCACVVQLIGPSDSAPYHNFDNGYTHTPV